MIRNRGDFLRFVLMAFGAAMVLGHTASAASKGTGKANRLLTEPSPYLQQHAYNPVNWYPWGEEAFAKARKENKPILLSVGYATCHWCHVMERESYSDAKIAELLNTSFVAIKVDRERRPEVDEIYILATQLITQQSGGWPNNVILTPDLLPFFGGTYFPRDQFSTLLNQVAVEWTVNRAAITAEGQRIGGLVDRVMSHREAAKELTPEVVRKAVSEATRDYDVFNGGVGQTAKFPRESLLLFLLDQAEKHGDETAREVALTTLDAMIKGGIHDHVGGGFHRYTVDPAWVVPHFEKMLYNQAGIGRALVQAHRITGDVKYAEAAHRMFNYVLRDMASKTGAFYSAFDADSKGGSEESEEGLFYVWTPDELVKVLGKDDADFAAKVFDITPTGNFEGNNVLHMPESLTDTAKKLNLEQAALKARLAGMLERLRTWREENRAAPFRDEKILTAWNGAMITALAEAGVAFNEPRYTKAAVRAANFFWTDMGAEKGELMRQHYQGKPSLIATQEGYVLLSLAFVSLYDVTMEAQWLERAKSLAAAMHTRFYDKKAGNYFMTTAGSGFYRPKTATDGDLPSGNAAAIDLFARLARRDLDPEYRSMAEAIMASISGNAVIQPASNAYTLRAADQLLRGETGQKQFIAKGRVLAEARTMPDGKSVKVSIRVAEGWHVNANQPLEDAFIPTVIETVGGKADGVTISYPEPLKRKLGFHDDVLALYEGEVGVEITSGSPDTMPRKLALTLQACSDQICLEPETVTLPVMIN